MDLCFRNSWRRYCLKYTNRFKFIGIEVFFWAAFASDTYLVVFLQGVTNNNNTMVGRILAISFMTGFFAPILAGLLSDLIRSVKKVFIYGFLLAALLFSSLTIFESIVVIALIIILIKLFQTPLIPLLDTWLIEEISHVPDLDYGRIRLGGSIGYGIMVFIYGVVIYYFKIEIIFITYGIMAIVTILFSLSIKTRYTPSTIAFKDLNPGELLKNYKYVSFVAISTIILIPFTSAFIYIPNIISYLGGTTTQLGVVYSLKALAEIPIFFSSKYLLKKFNYTHLILFAFILFMLQQYILLIATQSIHVILVQIISGLSFSLFLVGMVHYIFDITPVRLKATAQTLAVSFNGLSRVIGSYGGGWFIDNFGLLQMYKIGSLISFFMCVLFLIFVFHDNREQNFKYKSNL